MIGMLKICVALNKEKGIASFRQPLPMKTIRTMNTIDEFFPDLDAQNLRHIKQRKEHYFTQAKVTIRTIKTMNTTVGFSLIRMLKICVALIKEKGIASFNLDSRKRDDNIIGNPIK